VRWRPARGLLDTTSGYLDSASDPWTDLQSDHDLDGRYAASTPGNLVQAGRVPLTGLAGSQNATVSIGFGAKVAAAIAAAQSSLDGGFAAARTAYDGGWAGYLGSLKPVPASASGWSTEWKVSAMVLAASEDKTVRGGFVAAPNRAWAWSNSLQFLAVYHAVWSRDLYQIATGLLAIGDDAAANRALDFLWTVQQRADGSFPQNSRLDGTPVFGDLQMDEVAFPIVLAHQLGRTGAADWAHVKKSADYVVAHGPRTPQERWENATATRRDHRGRDRRPGLRGGHRDQEQRQRVGGDLPRQGRRVAADRRVDDGHHDGPYSSSQYYLRVTRTGTRTRRHDAGLRRRTADRRALRRRPELPGPGAARREARRRPGHHELGRGRRRPAELPTDNGRFWHRASFDGYGEQPTAAMGAERPGSHKTIGRGWPLLGGERGEYELLAGALTRPPPAGTMGKAADDASHLMAEQVWDHNPPGGSPGFTPASRPCRPRRWPGRTRSSCGWRPRSTPVRRSRPRRWWPAATTARPAQLTRWADRSTRLTDPASRSMLGWSM
jgi:glucoamylase